MEIKVYNVEGKESERIDLSEDIFNQEIKDASLREALLAYLVNRRQGTISTKGRSEVRGGGRKPWVQKGTGRARAGTIRSPLWIGGGVTFGPKPRKFKYPLSKKVRRAALKSSLTKKFKEGGILVLDKISLNTGKTKEMLSFLQKFSFKGKTLLILDQPDEKVRRSSSNLKQLGLRPASTVCGYDIFSHHNLCLTKKALITIIERLKK
ncbi:MAG: 50S ribosomal protein L4 [Candidatus Aerophobetes bacterium]|nr:50S ribosomal protein L4 [Candidatus Aerophobetes bacterium]